MSTFKVGFLVSLALLIAWVGDVLSAGTAGTDTYNVKEGDTLWFIAQKVLGDGSRWHEIWEKNPTIINPHLIFPGESLKVESVRIIQDSPQETELPPNDTSLHLSDMVDTLVKNAVGEISSEEQNQIEQQQVADDDIALDFLISSLINDLKSVLSQIDSSNISRIGTSVKRPLLPVYSLLFVSNSDLQTKDKYFVGDSDAFIISRGKVLPVDEKPRTSEMCDKVRKVSQIIEDKGKYLYSEESVEDYSTHTKMVIFGTEKHYYSFILTNVNELSPTLFLNKEPIDVLRVRIFSDRGYVYFTDKGLQGFSGYFYAVDKFGTPINIDPNDPIIFEKFDKTLDIFLAKISEKEKQKTDPRAKGKLNQIF